MAVTYVVTSYRNPRQLVRLLDRLRRSGPQVRLIVSHDCKTEPPPAAELARVNAELFLTPAPVTWGDDSYLRSVLHVFGTLELGVGDWVVLLTGQDYPIRPLADFHQHLQTSGADSLIEDAAVTAHTETILRRYSARSYRVPPWADRPTAARIVNRLPGMTWDAQPDGLPSYLSRRRLLTPFRAHMPARHGSDLFALNGRALDALRRTPPSLLRYYSKTRIPSESYAHTALLGRDGLVNSPEILHYSKWEGSPHPSWLGRDDVRAMMQSKRWFARKFREDDPVLDLLDQVQDG